MGRIDNHTDEDLQDELESRGYHVSQNDDGGLGCFVICGGIILVALIFVFTVASYIHYFIALSHYYHWTVYTIFFCRLNHFYFGQGTTEIFKLSFILKFNTICYVFIYIYNREY